MYEVTMLNTKGIAETMIVKGILNAIIQNKKNKENSLYNNSVKGFIKKKNGKEIYMWNFA